MKKYLLILFAMLISSNIAFAQDDYVDELGFEEVEYKEPKKPYFVISGGYSANIQTLDLKTINEHLAAKEFGFDEFSDIMFMHGVEFILPTFIEPKLRLGIHNYIGSSTQEKTVNIAQNDYTRTADLNISYLGLSLDYAIPLFSDLALVPSVAFGLGDYTLDIYQGKEEDWNDIRPSIDQLNWNKSISSSFYYVKPSITVDWAIKDYLMLSLGAAYNMSSSYDWKYNKNSDLNVPDDVTADGFSAKISIQVGIINF